MKKYIFWVSTFLLFSLILSLFLFLSEDMYDFNYHFLELFLVFLVYLSFSANIFLSGTGIVIFLFFCILIFAFSYLIFSQVSFLLSIPLLIIAQILVRRQFAVFFNEKRAVLLEIEKKREELFDKEYLLDQCIQKRIVLDTQIQRFSNLRNYISKINLSLSKEYLIEMVLNFASKNLTNGDIYSIAFLKNNKLVTSSFIVREGANDILLRPDKTDIVNDWMTTYWSPLRIENVNEDFRFQIQPDDDLLYSLSKSIIASPLISDDKPMGVLRIDSVSTSKFSLNDFRLLVIITSISALSLKNAELFKQTQKLSVTDGLTGLYHTKYMLDEISKYIDHSTYSKEKCVFSVLMMDLDFFKKINDTFGHVVGDNVLIKVATIIKNCCPESGFAVRYGGEEFALVVFGLQKQEVFELAEIIRKDVFKKKIVVRREKVTISVSIGVASYVDDNVESAKAILQKADERLYLAKKQGRNRTVVGL